MKAVATYLIIGMFVCGVFFARLPAERQAQITGETVIAAVIAWPFIAGAAIVRIAE